MAWALAWLEDRTMDAGSVLAAVTGHQTAPQPAKQETPSQEMLRWKTLDRGSAEAFAWESKL
jgi:hypothetical protein